VPGSGLKLPGRADPVARSAYRIENKLLIKLSKDLGTYDRHGPCHWSLRASFPTDCWTSSKWPHRAGWRTWLGGGSVLSFRKSSAYSTIISEENERFRATVLDYALTQTFIMTCGRLSVRCLGQTFGVQTGHCLCGARLPQTPGCCIIAWMLDLNAPLTVKFRDKASDGDR
jgi:hypothetical protein